jgi:hypothetical protein
MPRSHTIRREVLAAANDNPSRALAAALGVACPRAVKMLADQGKRIDYEASKCNPLRYGGELLDAFETSGVDLAQVIEAGSVAFQWLAESLISESEVRAELGNSEPPTAA